MRRDVTIHETKIQYSLAWPHDGRVDMGLSPKVIKVTIMVQTLDPQKMKHRWERKMEMTMFCWKRQNFYYKMVMCRSLHVTTLRRNSMGMKQAKRYLLISLLNFFIARTRENFQESDFLGVVTITVPYLGPAHNHFWSHWFSCFGFWAHLVFHGMQPSIGWSPM